MATVLASVDPAPQFTATAVGGRNGLDASVSLGDFAGQVNPERILTVLE